jgi:tungstate transport system ATP-binding protein
MNISIKNITKEYDNKLILNIDNYNIKKGKIIGIVGANGAGKSTLVKILGGLEKASGGRLLYDGEQDFNKIYKEITVVFQHPYLLTTSVYNNIAYPLKLRKFKKQEIKNEVNKLMEDVEIKDLEKQRANTLSGGERQKVALARALAFNPSLLLLDEPTANIDPNSMVIMENMIKKINKTKGTTIIIVTHNLAQAKRICDKVIVMDRGEIIEAGDIEEIMQNPQNIVTRNLINKEFIS